MEKLREVLKEMGIFDFGVMDYGSIPALIPCSRARLLPQDPKRVLSFVFPYYIAELPPRNLARYAVLPDYHDLILFLLRRLALRLEEVYGGSFVPFVDQSPLPEVFCAWQAGLGVPGRNGLLITEKYGSYVWLGELVTDRELPLSEPMGEVLSLCGDCRACITNCKNGAIGQTGVDYSLCISRLTQQKKPFTEEEAAAVRAAGFAWGCDGCQDCCPHNQGLPTLAPTPWLSQVVPTLTRENLDELLADRAFGYRGREVLLRNLSVLEGK